MPSTREQAPKPPHYESQKKRGHNKNNQTPKVEESNDTLFVNKVKYDSSDHRSVLTQMHGSIWPKVISYCIFNVCNTILVLYLRRKYDYDVSFSDRGHTFMSMMVSFLMVTRSNIAYARYMEARMDLSNATMACRELISYATTFTRYDKSPRAKKWRIDLARRTIKLLRTMVAVLEFQSCGNHAWKVPVLSREEKLALQTAVGKSNERSPMLLAMFVQSTIASNVEYLKKPLHPNKEMKLYSFVSDFEAAYHGLMKLVTTPFPFPLVQMTRTFLFIWVFTLPWVLVNDLQKTSALIFTVFFITYAFVGLEFVAIELDDPFGDDANDFDVLGLATVTFKDIYIYIYDLHGEVESKELLDFINEANQKSEQLDSLSLHKEAIGNGICSSISSSSSNHINGRNGGTRWSGKKHARWDSLQAWELSANIPQSEAGSEHSVLLQNEEQKGSEQLEAGGTQNKMMGRMVYAEWEEIVTQSYSSLPSPPRPNFGRNNYGTMDSKSRKQKSDILR